MKDGIKFIKAYIKTVEASEFHDIGEKYDITFIHDNDLIYVVATNDSIHKELSCPWSFLTFKMITEIISIILKEKRYDLTGKYF